MSYTLPVKSTERVLEIGSGHNPHPRSDVLCDRYLYNNQERQRFALRFDRPLVIAEGTRLPFADKAFDFVLCSQILEHTEEPLLFAQEISRVAKAGLIIVPHMLRERLFGWHYHPWYFYSEGEVLYFLAKRKQQPGPFAHFMHTMYAKSVSFRNYLSQEDRKLNIYFFWKDSVKIEKSRRVYEKLIEQVDKELEQLLSDPMIHKKHAYFSHIQELQRRASRKLKTIKKIKKWRRLLKEDPEYNLKQLTSMLRCPVTMQPLHYRNKLLVTPDESHSYSVDQGIPILLTETEKNKGY